MQPLESYTALRQWLPSLRTRQRAAGREVRNSGFEKNCHLGWPITLCCPWQFHSNCVKYHLTYQQCSCILLIPSFHPYKRKKSKLKAGFFLPVVIVVLFKALRAGLEVARDLKECLTWAEICSTNFQRSFFYSWLLVWECFTGIAIQCFMYFCHAAAWWIFSSFLTTWSQKSFYPCSMVYKCQSQIRALSVRNWIHVKTGVHQSGPSDTQKPKELPFSLL